MIFKILEKLRQKKMGKSAPLRGAGMDMDEEWRRVEELVSLGKPSNLKEAVIKADKILDYVLKSKFLGETMGERLKNAGNSILDKEIYQGLWDAHKLRNASVHEVGFEIPHFAARQAVEKFKKGIEALGIIIRQ